MKLLFSYLAARERSTGIIVFLAQKWSLNGGADTTEVMTAHGALLENPETQRLYSNASLVIENVFRNNYTFPDPAESAVRNIQDEIAAQQILLNAANDDLRRLASTASEQEAPRQEPKAKARIELISARRQRPSLELPAPVQGSEFEAKAALSVAPLPPLPVVASQSANDGKTASQQPSVASPATESENPAQPKSIADFVAKQKRNQPAATNVA